MRETSVSASLVIDVLAYLERSGIAPPAGVSVADLHRDHGRVRGSVMEQVWQWGESATGDPDLGLHTAEAHNPGALGLAGYLLWSCHTCRDALNALGRYAGFLNDGLAVHVETLGDETVCRFEAVAGLDNYLLRSPRQVIEAMAAGVVVNIRKLALSPVEPLCVDFRHAAPRSTGEHTRVFGSCVRFGQPENRVVFRGAELSTRLVSANPPLLEVFEEQMRAALAELEAGSVSRRVLTLLAGRFGGLRPSLDEVAAELAVSRRTLQRDLREEGTTYRQLLDSVRRNSAAQLLAQSDLTVAEAAFLLGFSEPGAFTRAFRRWTGSAPAHFRRG